MIPNDDRHGHWLHSQWPMMISTCFQNNSHPKPIFGDPRKHPIGSAMIPQRQATKCSRMCSGMRTAQACFARPPPSILHFVAWNVNFSISQQICSSATVPISRFPYWLFRTKPNTHSQKIPEKNPDRPKKTRIVYILRDFEAISKLNLWERYA